MAPGKNTRGADHPAWKGREIGYEGAHNRLLATRGKAAAHLCAHGCGRQAREWAYDHSDPNERTGPVGAAMLRYSPDPEHYLPLCKPCHAVFDIAERP